MGLKEFATCGTHSSSDIYIEVYPQASGLTIELESPVKAQFGAQIETVVRQVLASYQVQNARLVLVDHGALDCTIEARLKTALERGGAR